MHVAQAAGRPVNAWHTDTDPAQRLMCNGMVPGCEFVQGDFAVGLPAEERHLVARLRVRVAAEIDDALIHGHPTNERRSPAADQHHGTIRMSPWQTIGVPGW